MRRILLISAADAPDAFSVWTTEYFSSLGIQAIHLGWPQFTQIKAHEHVDAVIYNATLNHEQLHSLQQRFPDKPILGLAQQDNQRVWQINQFFNADTPASFNKSLKMLVEQLNYRDLLAESQVQLYGILSRLAEAVVVFSDKQLCFVNTPAQHLMDAIKPKLADLLRRHIQYNQVQKITVPGQDGKPRVIRLRFTPTEWREQSASLAILQDITDEHEEKTQLNMQLQEYMDSQIQTSQQLALSRNRIELILKSASEGYWDWFVPEGQVFFSPRWKSMLGYADHDIEPTYNTWVRLIHHDDLGLFLLTWTQYMEGALSQFTVEYRVLCKDGSYLWVEANGIKETDHAGNPLRLAGNHRDISQRKLTEFKLQQHRDNLEKLVAERTRELEAANNKLQALARLDALTELTNRRGFDENLNQELSRSQRDASPLCLIMIDIDYFKHYNDHYGHQEGDICIKQVARALVHSLQRPSDLAARYGGEELAILLPATDYHGAIRVSQPICNNIAALTSLQKNPFTCRPVSLSMGIAYNSAAQTLKPNELIELADRALYHTKHQGRNRTFYYDENCLLKQA